MKAFIDFYQNIFFREKILANVIELKKTYIVITFILWINHTYFSRLMNANVFIKRYNEWKKIRNIVKNSEQRFFVNSRSTLIVVFSILIQQWCDEFRTIVSDLIVMKYFDTDEKNDDNLRHEFKFYDKTYDIARNLKNNVRTIVVISYHIWIVRHELVAQAV